MLWFRDIFLTDNFKKYLFFCLANIFEARLALFIDRDQQKDYQMVLALKEIFIYAKISWCGGSIY